MASKTEVLDLTQEPDEDETPPKVDLTEGPDKDDETPPKVALAKPPSRTLFLSERDNAIVSPNLIGLMEDAFQNNNTIVYLKGNDMLHIQQTDKWSCGFRNLQMVLSSVLPQLPPSHTYYSKTASPPNCIPNVPQLQRLLERAWKEGFDPSGAQHYGRKIVHKTSKIGAVEVSTIPQINDPFSFQRFFFFKYGAVNPVVDL